MGRERVRLRINRNAPVSECRRRLHHPYGDLTPIGDQYAVKGIHRRTDRQSDQLGFLFSTNAEIPSLPSLLNMPSAKRSAARSSMA